MIPSLMYPCENRFITSPYGERPTTDDKFHDGTDFRGGKGDPATASAPGDVISARWRRGYGNYMIIDHASFQTAYAHLNDFVAKVGDKVKSGQLIGHIGNTGTTDPHLHFEVREGKYNAATYFNKTGDKFNNSVDPMNYILDNYPIYKDKTDEPEMWLRFQNAVFEASVRGSITTDELSTILAYGKYYPQLIQKVDKEV